MNDRRIFTDQELQEMGTRTVDLVLEAIDTGDKDRAKDLARRMYEEFSRLHDGYVFWVTGLQSYIYRNYGVEALEEAEREAHTIEARVVFKPIEAGDFRSFVEQFAKGLRGHLQPIAIEETDRMVTLTMQPCGSGEMIIQKGGYEAGLAKVKDPHRITWGMKDFPMHCVHCPIMEALDIENTGNMLAVHIVAGPPSHGACKFAIYKNPADIPEEYYARIGKKKPA